MTATTGYELIKHYQYFTDEGLVMLGAGFVTAFIVARLPMRWFIRFLARFTFVSFGVYPILLGLALLAWRSVVTGKCVSDRLDLGGRSVLKKKINERKIG